MNYDPVRELAPISQVAFTPNVLVVPNEVPARSVQELVALVRATPGKYTFGSAGVGTDLLGNRITMFFGSSGAMLPKNMVMRLPRRSVMTAAAPR